MHRWFFADEAASCDDMAAPSSGAPSSSSLGVTYRPVQVIPLRCWKFCVLMNGEMCPNERIAIVGDCDNLGNWDFNNCRLLTKDPDCNQWYLTVSIPRNHATQYRYLVVAIDSTNEKVIVRRWETHRIPRIVSETILEQPPGCHDVFGYLDGIDKIDRGWLTSEIIVQLKFFNAPFIWKQRMKSRQLFVKVTPMNLKIPTGCDNQQVTMFSHEDSLSSDNPDTRENGNDLSTSFAFNEVSTLCADSYELKPQTQFGTRCDKEDLVIFHLTIGDFESTAYLIDLYTYSSKAAMDEPPYHYGYHYVLPNLFKRSEGLLDVPITCATKHRPLGMMKVGYLIVKPVPSLPLDMSVSYIRYWNDKWTGLDVGHRGSGTSFKGEAAPMRENTITSLKNAVEHGADMVEFDVQLSKDLVPVVYHDFMVYVLLKAKGELRPHDYLSLPLRELTLEQLQNLTVYHTAEGRSRESRLFCNDDLSEHQPFPQLSEIFDAIDPHIGFNIEIKWSQKLQDGTMEEGFEHVIDRNLYVDCILDVVFRKAGLRRIVLSCFDPDICTMLRLKQNRYPVMFLTLGVTDKYKKYMDPRGNTIATAIFHSLAMELLGIVAHTEDILRDPSQLDIAKELGLIMFCWGDDNNSKDTIKFLKNLGLHAIIYDKMDVLTSKEVKQSVFLVQANQKELFTLQALEMGKKWLPPSPKRRLPCCPAK